MKQISKRTMSIPLGRGGSAIIDSGDYQTIKGYSWHKTNTGHVKSLKTNIYMHRLIMGVNDRKVVIDHINGDPSDNRRTNLRACTQAENSRNRKVRHDSKTGYNGVMIKGDKFLVKIVFQRRTIHIGTFSDTVEAARHYNLAAKKYFGEFAKFNDVTPLFPDAEYRRSASGYRGISKQGNRWRAAVLANDRFIHVGTFECLEEAARHFNLAAKKYHGESAKLNDVSLLFPEKEPAYCHSKTGYRGISMVRNRWMAAIIHSGVRFYLGCFKTKEEAARAYDKKAFELFGEKAKLNFK